MSIASIRAFNEVLGPALLSLVLLTTCAAAAETGIAPGYPDQVEDLDSREVAMLPGYCKYTQMFRDRVPGGNNPEEIKRWYAHMGPIFHAMHHYCMGLMKTNRALFIARDQQYKMHYLKSSIGEFDYVLRLAPRDFALLPEILTKKGENLIRLGQSPAGVIELGLAIDAKPDYWPPYVVLSDYYKTTGNAGKARETLEKGLSLSPDAKVLKKRLAELDQVKQKQKAAP